MINRWLVAVPVSFCLHAATGWYFVVNSPTVENMEKPAAHGSVVLSLKSFRTTPPQLEISHRSSPSPPMPQKQPKPNQPIPQREAIANPTATPIPSKLMPATEKAVDPTQEQKVTAEPVAMAPPSANPERFTESGLLLISDPVYLKRNKPVYPRNAIKRNQQGVVMVDATLNQHGYVIDTEVFNSSGHPLLDRSALKAVRNWQFEPAKRNGTTVLSVVRIPVEFRLD